MELFTIIGIVGAVLVCLAYIANETGVVSRKSFLYDGANLLAGSLLLSYSFSVMSLPFIAINVMWTFVALRDVVNGIRKGKAV